MCGCCGLVGAAVLGECWLGGWCFGCMQTLFVKFVAAAVDCLLVAVVAALVMVCFCDAGLPVGRLSWQESKLNSSCSDGFVGNQSASL